MKISTQFLAALLVVLTLSTTSAFAHSHPTNPTWTPSLSSWAVSEVNKAKDLGLVSEGILNLKNYKAPITRAQFRELAMNFVAVQEHSSLHPFIAMTAQNKGKTDTNGAFVNPFTDGSEEDAVAYYLGLVEGRGSGIFDPNGQLNRQEAAVMLTRAYAVIGGTMPQTAAPFTCPDSAKIDFWAKDSATILNTWKVMNGYEDGSFAPKDPYSVEQCIVTLLRLR